MSSRSLFTIFAEHIGKQAEDVQHRKYEHQKRHDQERTRRSKEKGKCFPFVWIQNGIKIDVCSVNEHTDVRKSNFKSRNLKEMLRKSQFSDV